MKSVFAVAIVGIVSMTMLLQGSMAQDESKKPVVERIVVPEEGVTEFTVTGRSTKFRLSISTIAGGTIEDPKITGNVKHLQTAEIVRVGKGGEPVIGALNKEFLFQGSGAGKATIEIKKTLPTEPMPVVEKFTVTIK